MRYIDKPTVALRGIYHWLVLPLGKHRFNNQVRPLQVTALWKDIQLTLHYMIDHMIDGDKEKHDPTDIFE